MGVLSIYGIHRYVILYLYHRHYKWRRSETEPPRPPACWPTVTIQLPLYNEFYVAQRAIDAVSAIRYPPDRLRIQILDDSTDETTSIAFQASEVLRTRGLNVEFRHRSERRGYKAGALQEGLDATPDEIIAIFDADFVPPADFLERTVPYFADSGVGMVQTRWGYLNRDYSLLTRVQALLLDGHFMLEHTARSRSGRYFNFNGTGGLFRRAAVLDAGGWESDTLTEDLDLSYRAQLRGWRFVFLPHVECPSELPVAIFSFKNQQHRWTKGSIQVGRKLLARIWRSDAPLKVKIEATFHLSANLSYLLLVLLSILMPFAVSARVGRPGGGSLVLEAVVFGLTTASVLLFYVIAQRELHHDWRVKIRDIPLILAIGVGMCVNNAWAVTEGLLGHESSFVRTAKFRIESLHDRWKGKRYRAAHRRTLLLEMALALYMVLAFISLAATSRWAALPYLGLFVTGYLHVVGLSVAHARHSVAPEADSYIVSGSV